MDHEIRQLTHQDEPILWEMLYYGLSSAGKDKLPSRDVVRRPEISRYVEGWGRVGDTGFVAHDNKNQEHENGEEQQMNASLQDVGFPAGERNHAHSQR